MTEYAHAAMLRPWLKRKASGKAVFEFRVNQLARMVRRDLKAAAIAEPGKYDFHGLRHTFVSLLVRSGASIKAVETLARHANPSMSLGVYAHVGIFDLTQGLEGLKGLSHALPTACVPMGLTGTDAIPVDHSETPENKALLSPGGTSRNLHFGLIDEAQNSDSVVQTTLALLSGRGSRSAGAIAAGFPSRCS